MTCFTAVPTRFGPRRFGALLLCVALVAVGCAGSSADQVSASQDGVPTTPPLAVPPTDIGSNDQAAPAAQATGNDPVATSAPIEIPTTAPTESALPAATAAPAVVPTVTAAPAAEEAPPTAVPATAVPATEVPATEVPATAVPATEVPATAVPATAVPATAVPATAEPTATPVPAAPVAAASGPAIALGDFDVVNLVTGATQNIAELAPSGATVLWFWAPH